MSEQQDEEIVLEVFNKDEEKIPVYLFLLTEEEKQVLNQYIRSTFPAVQ